jgi:ribonuclease HI
MIVINTDSAIEPFNPNGILTWAFIAKKGGQVIHQDTKIIGWGKGMTNNRGEMAAVVAAMLWLIKLPKEKQMQALIQSDSQLIVNQCKGVYQCHDEILLPMKHLIDKAKIRYSRDIIFRWIPREKNTEADALSRSLYTEKALQLMKSRKLDILFDGDDITF